MLELIDKPTDYIQLMNTKLEAFNTAQEQSLIRLRKTYRDFWELDIRPNPSELQEQFRRAGKARLDKLFYTSYVMAMTLKSILHVTNDDNEYLGLWQPGDERMLDYAYNVSWDGDDIVVGPIKEHWNNG